MARGAGVRSLAGVAGVLHPDGVHPLEHPRGEVDVARRVDPEVLALLGAGGAEGLEEVGPGLPHVARVVHVVRAAGHVVVAGVGAGAQGEAVPLPVIDVETLLVVQEPVLEVLDVGAAAGVDALPVVVLHLAGALAGKVVGKGAEVVVAALGTDPDAEGALQVMGEGGGGVQLVGELLVELPEARLVVGGTGGGGGIDVIQLVVVGVPAVVHHIGIQGLHAILGKPFFGTQERLLDARVIDVHHVVVPGVVLLAEVAGRGDVVDVGEEVGLHHGGVGALGGAHHVAPGAEGIAGLVHGLAVLGHLRDGLAAVVAHLHGVALDVRVLSRKLRAEEHTVGVDGLAEHQLVLPDPHGGDLAQVGDAPEALDVPGQDEAVELDVVDGAGGRVARLDLEVAVHVVGAVLHGGHLGDLPRHATELDRGELGANGVLIVVHGDAGELEVARLDGRVALGGRGALVLEEVELGTRELLGSAQGIRVLVDPHVAGRARLVKVAVDGVAHVVEAVRVVQVVVRAGELALAGGGPALPVIAHVKLVLAHGTVDAVGGIGEAGALVVGEAADGLLAAQVDHDRDGVAGHGVLVDIGVQAAIEELRRLGGRELLAGGVGDGVRPRGAVESLGGGHRGRAIILGGDQVHDEVLGAVLRHELLADASVVELGRLPAAVHLGERAGEVVVADGDRVIGLGDLHRSAAVVGRLGKRRDRACEGQSQERRHQG